MPGKVTTTQNTTKETPVTNGAAPEGSTEALLEMQREAFSVSGEKTEGEKTESGESDSVVQERGTLGKDRADQIFEKVTKANSEIGGEKKTTTKTKTTESKDETDPDFMDFTEFSEDGTSKKDESVKDETGEDENESEDEKETEVEPDYSTETNIKNLRQGYRSIKEKNEQLSAENQTLKSQGASSEAVKNLQTKVNELQTRVKQLEPYEMVYALHENPDFRSKFIEVPTGIHGEMTKIAKDYDVSEEVISDFLAADSRKVENEILSDAFDDLSARADLKSLKQRYSAVMRERRDMEKKPKEVLEKLSADRAQKESERTRKRDAYLDSLLTDGWTGACEDVSALSAEKRIQELREVPGQKDHNEKVVRPTLREAQNVFTTGMSYIEKVARNQAVVTPEFARWFANICQQAAATQTINRTRNVLFKRYQALKDGNRSDTGRHLRPGVTPPARGRSTVPPRDSSKLRTADEISSEIFTEVQKRMPE